MGILNRCRWFGTELSFDVFCFCNLPKIQRGDPCKMSNINVVQSFIDVGRYCFWPTSMAALSSLALTRCI